MKGGMYYSKLQTAKDQIRVHVLPSEIDNGLNNG